MRVVLAVVVTVGLAVGCGSPSGASTAATSSSPAGTSSTASGCSSLSRWVSTAQGHGFSIVEAYGELTGRSGTDDQTPYREMKLTRTRTLAGPAVASVLSGWIALPPRPAPDPADAPGLWAPDGHLVAVVAPSAETHLKLGPQLRLAPVVGNDVILSAVGCWGDPSLDTAAFTGHLREVPGSHSYDLAMKYGGFRAYAVQDFARLVRPLDS